MSTRRLPTKKAALEFLRALDEVTSPAWGAATQEFAVALKTAMSLQAVTFEKKSVPQEDIIELAFALLANQERYFSTMAKSEPQYGAWDGLNVEVLGPAQRKLVFAQGGCNNPACVVHHFRNPGDVRAHAAKIVEFLTHVAPLYSELPYLRQLVADAATVITREPDGILLNGKIPNSNVN